MMEAMNPLQFKVTFEITQNCSLTIQAADADEAIQKVRDGIFGGETQYFDYDVDDENYGQFEAYEDSCDVSEAFRRNRLDGMD